MGEKKSNIKKPANQTSMKCCFLVMFYSKNFTRWRTDYIKKIY